MLFAIRNDVSGRKTARLRCFSAIVITALTLVAVGSGFRHHDNTQDPIIGIARLPASIDAVVVVEDAASLRSSDAGRAVLDAIVETGLLTKTTKSWAELAQSLGWTPDEAFDELFGRRVVLVFDDVSKKGEARWVVMADVDRSTQTRIRKKLKLAPRTIENNTRVLAGERGRFRLAVIPSSDGSDLSSLLIAPVDHKAFFFQSLDALTADDADLPRLGDTKGYHQLQKLERRPLRLIVQQATDAGDSSTFFALSAKRVETDWIAHWSGSLDLLGISPELAQEAHAWPWRAFERVSEDALVAVMGVAGRIETETLSSLGRFVSGLMNVGGAAAAFKETGPVQMFAIHRTAPSSVSDGVPHGQPQLGLTIAAQWADPDDTESIDKAISKFIAKAAASPSRTKLDMKGAFPGAVRSVKFESCEQSELKWIFPNGEDVVVSWSQAQATDRSASNAWWLVQIAGEQLAGSSRARLKDVSKTLAEKDRNNSSTNRISMGVVRPREFIDWLTDLGMQETGELAMFEDIDKIRWDARITDDQLIDGEARISVRPSLRKAR